jgi:hypothetical protein
MAARFQNVSDQDAYCPMSVFRWIHEVCRGNEDLQNEGHSGRSCQHEIDAAIQSIRQDESNASLRAIGDTLSISLETVRIHMARIGYPLKALRWIPHILKSELKQARLTMCMQLLPKLRAHAHNNLHSLVTGDESWFYREYVRDRIWTTRDENPPERTNRTIASRKSMLTVLWNPHEFHIVTMLPLGISFKASWFVDQNLVHLLHRFFAGGWDRGQRKFLVHLGNTATHNPKVTQNIFEHSPLKKLPQPPYSSNISPSDFYLFGKAKNSLIGQEIPDEIGLLEIVMDILDRVSGDELQAVFRSWIGCVQGEIW